MTKKDRKATTSKKKRAAGKSTAGRGGAGRSFEARLRAAVSTVDAAHTLTVPLIRSVEKLLQLAARELGSGEASVLVRDGTRGGLKFLVVISSVAEKLLKMRIPPGKGIAGFVFASGQPMAVADVTREASFYAEVDRATGYSTQTILATPLQVNGQTVGVLEFVNRLGQPPYEPFTPNEMDLAARFADPIATLVDAHESAEVVETLFTRAFRSVGEEGGDVRRWLKSLRAAPEHRDLIALAVLLSEVAGRGEAERVMCREMLVALARWTAQQRRVTSSVGYFA